MGTHTENVGIDGHGFKYLLFFLLLYLVGSPFLDPYPSVAILVHLSLSITLFVAVYTVQKHQQRRSVAMILLLVLLVLYWLGIYDIIHFSRLGSYLLFVVYFGLLMYSYIMQLARFQKVTVNVLYATLCLYLIIGLFWGSLYALLYELSPGAYSGTLLDNVQGSSLHIFNYFSMVTLTTLGYGDITPQTPGAGALCQMEAIIGQFFTAVVVAWLVGSIITEKETKS
jgi:voltage-gated potassium channel